LLNLEAKQKFQEEFLFFHLKNRFSVLSQEIRQKSGQTQTKQLDFEGVKSHKGLKLKNNKKKV
jgi:hypothetical protein